MPDFGALLKKPAGEAKRPPVLPGSDYPAIIKSHEYDDKNKNKTPYVRFHLALTGWGDGVPDEWSVFDNSTGKSYNCTKWDVDLSKRQMRKDFYLTDDAMWRLDEFLRSIGIEPQGRNYEEVIPDATGAHVLATVTQTLNQLTNETWNQVEKVVGVK